MRKHKKKIIAGIVILAVLAGAWVYSDIIAPNHGEVIAYVEQETEAIIEYEDEDNVERDEPTLLLNTPGPERQDDSRIVPPTIIPETEPEGETFDVETPEAPATPEAPDTSRQNDNGAAPPTSAPETESDGETSIAGIPEVPTTPESPETPRPDDTPSDVTPIQPPSGGGIQIQPPSEGNDLSSVPTPSPSPTPAPDESFTVTLTVRVDRILNNMDLLSDTKHFLVPDNGVIFPTTQVRVNPGDTVFDVLQREMRQAGIHMSSRWTPVFNSAYIEAINNLYEFDVGPLSGWMYRVNGWFPDFGSSLYELSPGDVIEWHYTVDLGRDLGVTFG